MAHVATHVEDIGVESPYLVEGLPGVGLVGKIAVDHLVTQWEMEHVATVQCDGIPDVAVYGEGTHDVTLPVRLYADAERNLLALQSDVPVSPEVSTDFAAVVTDWLHGRDATPLYLVGLATEKDGVPGLTGIATGEGDGELADVDVPAPSDSGMVSGPTGALLAEAEQTGLDAVGLIVEANAQFPDPEAARILLTKGIEPITGLEVDTEALVEQAEEIAEARERLAQRMEEGVPESTSAQPVGMYQ